MKLLPWRGRTSKPAFRDRVCAALRDRMPEARIEARAELEIRISDLPSRAQVDIWLERVYDEFCQAPHEAAAIIERTVESAALAASDPPLDLDRIIPTLEPHDWLDCLRLPQPDLPDAAKAGFTPWVEPFNSELCVVYAEYRDGIRYGQRADLAALGLSSQNVRERALANLRRMIEEVTVAGSGGSYLLGAGGTLDASLMLLDEVIGDPRLTITGQPLVGVSDRGSCWVADDSNPWAVFHVTASVAHCHRSEPYPISPSLYQRSGRGWEPLDPSPVDATHPIPDLHVIDMHAVRKSGGSDLLLVIASPLAADARSIFRLCRKLDSYLEAVNSDEFARSYGPPAVATTTIIVRLHPRCDPAVADILTTAASWAMDRNASLRVEKITPVAVT